MCSLVEVTVEYGISFAGAVKLLPADLCCIPAAGAGRLFGLCFWGFGPGGLGSGSGNIGVG